MSRMRILASVFLIVVFLGPLPGCDSLLEVENPSSIEDGDIRTAENADLWANGVLRMVQRGWDGMLLLVSTASDEFHFVGPHAWWGEIDQGRIDEPENAGLNSQYQGFAAARWMADEAIDLLAGLHSDGELNDPTPLGRVYLYGAIAYATLADGLEDYAPADRTEPAPAIGPDDMASLYDTAVAYATRGLALEVNTELRRNLLAMRARAQHARQVWYRIRPPPADVSGGGLVSDAGAAQDARDVLSLDPEDWRFEFNYLPQIQGAAAKGEHCFGNLRVGDRYVTPDPVTNRGAESVILDDPIDGVPDPWLEQFILTEFYHDGPCNRLNLTVFSAREMHLILAEEALANGDVDDFAEHVNDVRALGSLTPWTPDAAVSARDLLIYERQSQLFLTGRRLGDLYRFGLESDTWDPASAAATAPGTLFPIPSDEIEVNCYLNGSCG